MNPRGRYPARADCGVTRVRATAGDVLRFSTGRFVRVLAARWIGAEPTLHAAAFMLSMASLSALGYEHDLSRQSSDCGTTRSMCGQVESLSTKAVER